MENELKKLYAPKVFRIVQKAMREDVTGLIYDIYDIMEEIKQNYQDTADYEDYDDTIIMCYKAQEYLRTIELSTPRRVAENCDETPSKVTPCKVSA